jgi:phospholipid transport system substrate-binding protein
MNQYLSRLFAAAALVTVVIPAQASADMAPDLLAKNTTQEVLAIVRQDREIQAGNMRKVYDLVDAKVLPHFDFNRMTQLALGKHWGRTTPEQKQSLVREFRTLLVRTYASSLKEFGKSGVDFKPLNLRPGDTDVTVKTEVRLPGAQPVPIDYSMEKMAEGWKVYDVAVDGVSLVTNYRASFANEIRANGIDGLIQTLAAKNTSIMDGESGRSRSGDRDSGARPAIRR